MFSRNSDKDPPSATGPTTAAQARPTPMTNGGMASGPSGTTSVIGSDLAIIGSGLRIVAQKTLQVDGEVQGDVIGSKVVIGPSGKVTGLVNAENVHINGAVFGTIKGVEVVLSASAVVEGDIFHQAITLEQGAQFEGRSRRPQDRAELVPDLSTPGRAQPSDDDGAAMAEPVGVAPAQPDRA